MAEPDNVARVIAAGSALVTAANMAVSYATYRRKRPTLAIKPYVGGLLSRSGGTPEPGVLLVLTSRGETPARISGVFYERRWPNGAPQSRLARLAGRSKWGGRLVKQVRPHGDRWQYPLELPGLQAEAVEFYFIGCTKELASQQEGAQERVRVMVSGLRWVKTPWRTTDFSIFSCSCADCCQAGQLSFDDLVSQQ